jgi:20S proteasome alpha/beta subunit
MTLCLAATCDKGQGVIIAADRMMTSGLSIEFEHQSSRKIIEVSPRCFALTAGDALAHTELFTTVQARIGRLADPSVEESVETIKECYQTIRQKRIVEQILLPRGFRNLAEFYQAQRHLTETIVYGIQGAIDKYNYGLHILVGGLSGHRAHIYGITDPGTSQCWDSINFHAIGSGAPHAIISLIARSCHQNLPAREVLMMVLDAKRTAEKAPGVGEATDLCIIMREGKIEIPRDRVKKLLPINDLWRAGEPDWIAELGAFLTSLAPTASSPPPGTVASAPSADGDASNEKPSKQADETAQKKSVSDDQHQEKPPEGQASVVARLLAG